MSSGSDPVARLDVEWIAIKAGLKPANRITIAPERADELAARARREGFTVERAARPITFPGRPASVVIYVSPDPARARALADTEAPLLPSEHAPLGVDAAVVLHARFGRLLGFPDCCVDEFCTRLRRGVTRRANGSEAHEDFVAAEYAAHASTHFFGRLNDLVADRRMRIVTFYPCRYDCSPAAEYAAAVFSAAERIQPAAAAALRAALLGPAAIATDGSRGAAPDLRGEVLTVDFNDF